MWIAVFGISDMIALTERCLRPARCAFCVQRLRANSFAGTTVRRRSNSAMVAAPFLALVFAILETAIVFFAGQTLETAAADSARLIMTGQAQTTGLRARREFKTAGLQRGSLDCSIAPTA